MIRGAIFDMDGTLVDNSAVHVRAFEIFCERYGVRDWREKLAQAFGMGNDDILRRIMPAEIIQDKGLAALADEKEAIYREIYAPPIRPVE
ncbi:MAG: HAD hydrolase-like protein, partial [Alistipes sp.]|nr:HAD hydrolase-like protein [Alistipes sp.]